MTQEIGNLDPRNRDGVLECQEKTKSRSVTGIKIIQRRAINFDELDSTLMAVDLLAELTLPDEVVEFSRNAWMKLCDGRYLLACGSSSAEDLRMALLEYDALGFYSLTLSSASRPSTSTP